MDCFPDYCLTCDKQIVDGLYCSQACRLTDLERAGSTPSSPLTPTSSTTTPFGDSYNSSTNHTGLHLAPALDFYSSASLAHQRSISSSSLRSTSYDHHPKSGRHHSTSCPSTPFRMLSPSSSRSSLASGVSGIQTQFSDRLSEEDKNELRGYYHSFEHTRERRRQSQPYIKHTPTTHANTTGRLLSSFADDDQ